MSRLGKYEILELIGTGSMGTVSRARDTMIDREVALKTIRTGSDIDPEIRERFYREARSCGRLHHPNIVTIYDLGETDQTAYIAMELLDGTDFRALIKEHRAATIPEKLDWMSQVCDALSQAHGSGVIHRDVKPSNLFLTKDNCVKVLDFGIAKLPSSQLTVTGKILGTPNYMAPEQILAKPTDGRSDLFSAAVVLFELLAYQHPFRGKLVPQRIVQTEPDSLTELGVSVPAILEKVLQRGLAKAPEHRYATGALFAQDLRTIADAMRRNDALVLNAASLPSDQDSNHSQSVTVNPVEEPVVSAPDGEDPAEWRYSQVLDLLPQFEYALQESNSADANRHFNSLLRITSGDPRFNQAMVSCRARLDALKPQATATLPEKPEPVSAAAVANQPTVNLDICLHEDESILGPVIRRAPPIAPPPPKPVLTDSRPAWDEETIFDRPAVVPAGAPKPKTEEKQNEPTKRAAPQNAANSKSSFRVAQWVKAHPKQALADVAALVFLIAGVLLFRVYSAVPNVEHAVALAKASDILTVRKSADASAPVLYYLQRGEDLNILSLPESRLSWVKVQQISGGKAMKPGFAQSASLADWKGMDASSSYALFKTFHDAAPVTDAEMSDRAAALADLSSRYAGTAEAVRAKAEELEIRYAIIQNKEKNGLSGDALRAELESLLDQTQKAGESAKTLRDQITAKLAQPPANMPTQSPSPTINSTKVTPPQPRPPNQTPVPPIDSATLIAQGDQRFNEGNYESAIQIARRVLRREPNNSAAKGLLDKASRAANAEK